MSTLSPEETVGTIGTLGPIGYPFHVVNQWTTNTTRQTGSTKSGKLGKKKTGLTLPSKEPVTKHTANQINLFSWQLSLDCRHHDQLGSTKSAASLIHLISEPDESAASALWTWKPTQLAEMVDMSESIAGKRNRANGKDDGSKWCRNQKKRYQE